MALAAYKIEDRDMMFASTVDFRLSLGFFDSGLYTCAAVARLTLALAKLSCFGIATPTNCARNLQTRRKKPIFSSPLS